MNVQVQDIHGPAIPVSRPPISLYEFYESKMGVLGVNHPEIFNSKVQTNLDVYHIICDIMMLIFT